jgi:hypothetical protein
MKCGCSTHFSMDHWPKLSTHALEKCCGNQPSATSPLFFDNLHFDHFDKRVNMD